MSARAATIAIMFGLTLASTPAQQPRDGAPPPTRTGTAVVTGLVVSTDNPPGPVRRARVTLSSPALPMALTGITDDDGRFLIERVPAGRYTVEAAKEAYLTTAFGAARPGRPGRPLVLADGREHSVSLRLQRGSVMTGTVTDAQGQPVPGVSVTALRFGYQPNTGDRVPIRVGSFGSDDRGNYRAFGLPPGDYLVRADPTGPTASAQLLSSDEIRRAMAAVASTRVPLFFKSPGMPPAPRPSARTLAPPSDPPRVVSFAPVYHPGSARLAQARAVTLGAAEERLGVDIQMEHVPVATVEGVVTGPAGPARGATVRLVTDDGGTAVQMSSDGRFVIQESPGGSLGISFSRGTPGQWSRTMPSDPNGRFRFANVPPGQYTLQARTLPVDGLPAGGWAEAPVILDGDDLSGVALALHPALTIAGRLEFDGGAPPTAPLAILKTSLPVQTAVAGPGAPPMLQTAADGRFVISGIVPGALRPLATLQGIRTPMGGWWLHSIALGGRELLDAPLDIRASADDAVVTFSTRASEIAGRVTGSDGQPISGPHLIVFSARPEHWYPLSRRIVATPLPADGRYRVLNLPAGDYLLVVDDDVDPGQWFDPSYLGRMAGQARRVRIEGFEKTLHDLMVPGR